MPDSKITALASIGTGTDPAVDPLVIVDVSDTSMAASGTTKKVTLNQLLATSPTATLASATITGDLTVRTTGLVVTSTAVGIGTSPNTWSGAWKAAQVGRLTLGNATTDSLIGHNFYNDGSYRFAANDFASYYDQVGGAHIWGSSVTPGTAGNAIGWTVLGTLNSTGLGVGVSPSYKLQSVGFVAASSSTVNGSVGNLIGALLNSDDANSGLNPGLDIRRWTGTALNHGVTYIGTNAAGDTLFYNGSVASNTRATLLKMTLDASGNLLVTKTSPNATVVGFQATPTGETSSTMASSSSAQSTLNVYSTGAAAYRFYVGMNGTINATNTTIAAISDQRLKENVQDIDVGLGAILALKPRKFDWKAGKGKDIKGDRGFIAQEFEQVFPNLVDEWKDAAPEGEAPYKSVRQDLIPVLVKAIQELAARVEALEA